MVYGKSEHSLRWGLGCACQRIPWVNGPARLFLGNSAYGSHDTEKQAVGFQYLALDGTNLFIYLLANMRSHCAGCVPNAA